MSCIGDAAMASSCSSGLMVITEASILPLYMMGLGVSALLSVNVGTALPSPSNSMWLKYTLPLETRSMSPSPLMSLKYSVVCVFVLTTSPPAIAVNAIQPTVAFAPPVLVELLTVEKLLIPDTFIASPYVIPSSAVPRSCGL